jgi:cell shape-determining protein MreC
MTNEIALTTVIGIQLISLYFENQQKRFYKQYAETLESYNSILLKVNQNLENLNCIKDSRIKSLQSLQDFQTKHNAEIEEQIQNQFEEIEDLKQERQDLWKELGK